MTTTAKGATLRAADLEAAAQAAAAAAEQARADAQARQRVESAASARAGDAWHREQIDARRPHAAITALSAAWDVLVETLASGTDDMIGAWTTYQHARGEHVATIRAFEGGIYRNGPLVPQRFDPNRHDAWTFFHALEQALTRAGDRALSLALEDTGDSIEAERQAATDAAIAALPADAHAEPVACFYRQRYTSATGHGWSVHNLTEDVLAAIDFHDSGVAFAYSALAAGNLRTMCLGQADGDARFGIEVEYADARHLTAVHDYGENGDRDPDAHPELGPGLSADERAEIAERAGAAADQSRQPAAPSSVNGSPAPITERSDAAPAVDPDRA